MAGVVLVLAAALPAGAACDGDVRLMRPVALSDAERAAVAAMAPLTVLAVDAPPMSRWDEQSQRYTGIAVDAWCFIAEQIGLRYEVRAARGETVAQKIAQVQAGTADVFFPLSSQSERARLGRFTQPFYESPYAVIARKARHLPVHSLENLAAYRVGVIKGVAFEPILRQFLEPSHLVVFDQTKSDGLFEAVRRGDIDVAVYPRGIFEEKRWQHEYFDLTAVHTLRDAPRAYRFYFSISPEHERLAGLFDRYLQALDLSRALEVHEDGERELIQRYVAQQRQRVYWQAGTVVAVVLAVVFFFALRRYRRLSRQLTARNRRILRQQRALATSHRALERLSQTDGLTGLSNRRSFDHALIREHARHQRTGAPLSLVMVDIDHFKCVNDHYGHAVGDDYLRAVARVLQTSAARPTDLTARYGGEEFVCLLPDTGAREAQNVAERIRQAVAQLQLPNAAAPAPMLTLSLGIATQVGGKADAMQLVERADEALYAAKHAGRDGLSAVVIGN